CPTITFLDAQGKYCEAITDANACRACLAAQREFANVDIVAWREGHRAVLVRSAFLIAPSQWAATMLRRYFPEHSVAIIAHGSGHGMPRDDAIYTRLDLPDDGVPTVAVIGAIGADKGARRLERLVELTRTLGLRLRWVLIGYLDRGREQSQSADAVFTQHGPFDSREIGALLAHYRVRLVAYPSAGPETFSFTLSEAWAAGRPVIVPPFGALAERVSGTGAGWIWTEDEWRDEEKMLDRIMQVVAPAFATELDVASQRAKARPQPMLTTMAQRTLELYDRALAAPPAKGSKPLPQPLDAIRVRDALGYVPW